MAQGEKTGTRELPRGRHRFTREAVAESQRSRLLAAVAQSVATNGYTDTTVGDVVALAAVSRRTFYEHYSDLEACFLAAYRDGMDWLFDQIRSAVRAQAGAGWRDRVRVSVEAYLAALAARPAAAHAFTIEAMGGGQSVLEYRSKVMQRWVSQWGALEQIARRESSGWPPVGEDHLLVLVGGIEELVRACLVSGDAADLPHLAVRISEICVRTIGGQEQ
jgi:AcrR family transcriptional regulator